MTSAYLCGTFAHTGAYETHRVPTGTSVPNTPDQALFSKDGTEQNPCVGWGQAGIDSGLELGRDVCSESKFLREGQQSSKCTSPWWEQKCLPCRVLLGGL